MKRLRRSGMRRHGIRRREANRLVALVDLRRSCVLKRLSQEAAQGTVFVGRRRRLAGGFAMRVSTIASRVGMPVTAVGVLVAGMPISRTRTFRCPAALAANQMMRVRNDQRAQKRRGVDHDGQQPEEAMRMRHNDSAAG